MSALHLPIKKHSLHISKSSLCFLLLFVDKITEGEFIQGIMDNKNILRLIQFDEPQKVQERLKEKKQ